MIPSEDERQRAVVERCRRALIQPVTDLGDVVDVFLCLVRWPLHLRNRRGKIAFVHDRPPEGGNLIANTRDTEGRRSHVHATPPGAEIERDADQVDWFHELPDLVRHRHSFGAR